MWCEECEGGDWRAQASSRDTCPGQAGVGRLEEMIIMFSVGTFQDDPEVHSVVTSFRRRDGTDEGMECARKANWGGQMRPKQREKGKLEWGGESI